MESVTTAGMKGRNKMTIDTQEVIKKVEVLKKSIEVKNETPQAKLITQAMILAWDAVIELMKIYEKIEGERIALNYKEAGNDKV